MPNYGYFSDDWVNTDEPYDDLECLIGDLLGLYPGQKIYICPWGEFENVIAIIEGIEVIRTPAPGGLSGQGVTMSDTKHTPAPWKFGWEREDREWGIVTDKNGNIVANVNTETGPDIPPLVSIKMPGEANARLIAAAPDLLTALTEVLARLERVNPLPDGGTSSMRDYARRAIAAAKGETP